ncbi:helix-turn-helix domain-containing protein [Vagococcus vulneris]|uniref:Helicase Helix-turn-helix domain-containing protein n=1 Tax=Vagococcus vulneris TaxID=1977869 RepID=A0A430A1Y3_9ENTE|nr:helix-turn-helix domain-containing protein [Vagococcus vulneris]RSU00451.1 hypothetical protein CBF37_00110 [Vagococcus vulneris]
MDLFILSCFKHQRLSRYSTLYHLLVGKKTASVLIYGYFNNILPFFKLFPDLNENDFKRIISKLIKEKLLVSSDNNLIKISPKGLDALHQAYLPTVSSLSGLTYGKIDQTFWTSLLLAVQVFSEKRYDQSNYLPIETNAFKLYSFKKWYRKQPANSAILFGKEWLKLSEHMEASELTILVNQLSGHQHIGYTLEQIAYKQQTSVLFMYIEFKNSLHKLIEIIQMHPQKFLIFNSLLSNELIYRRSDTASSTYQTFLKNASIAETAKERRLKVSTVTDHLLESVLQNHDKQFFLNTVYQWDCLKKLNLFRESQNTSFYSWRYSDVKEAIPELSFFEFRLFQIKLKEDEINGN